MDKQVTVTTAFAEGDLDFSDSEVHSPVAETGFAHGFYWMKVREGAGGKPARTVRYNAARVVQIVEEDMPEGT